MNEQIRNLMLKAISDVDNVSNDPDGDLRRMYIPNVFATRFAELIVAECIGCCEQVVSDPVPESVDTWLNGGEQCIQEIKQHFGLGMSVADKKQLIKDLLGVNNEHTRNL